MSTGHPASIALFSSKSNKLTTYCLKRHGETNLFLTRGDLKITKNLVTATRPRLLYVLYTKFQMSTLGSFTGEDTYLDHDRAINRGSLWKGSQQFLLA
jgi:hypothetical protein